MAEINVRPVESMADIQAIENVQRQTWGMPEVEVVPSRLLHALQHNGASLLGAYDGDKIVGFAFGVLGTAEELADRVDQVAAARLQIYSAISGVLPEYQAQGVGYKLKVAQREFALRLGVHLITWTYDPLESRNGYFNVSKLGAVCSRYLRDFHGSMGGINAGLSTDRFHVDWWVTSNRVQIRLSPRRGPLGMEALLGGGAVLVNASSWSATGLPVPPADFDLLDRSLILAEIPADFQRVKREDMALALRWREHSRHLFETYFQHKFLVTDFVRHTEADGQQRSFYLLTSQDS